MKHIVLDEFMFDRAAAHVTIRDLRDGGPGVMVSRDLLARALAALDAPEPQPTSVPAVAGGWSALTVDAMSDGRPCRYRTGVARGDAVEWSEWRDGHMRVDKRDFDVPRAHRDQTRYWRAGDPASVGIMGRFDVTEYTPDELDGGVFTADGGDVQILLHVEVPT